jgi:hypothetical protein
MACKLHQSVKESTEAQLEHAQNVMSVELANMGEMVMQLGGDRGLVTGPLSSESLMEFTRKIVSSATLVCYSSCMLYHCGQLDLGCVNAEVTVVAGLANSIQIRKTMCQNYYQHDFYVFFLCWVQCVEMLADGEVAIFLF